MTEAPGRVVSVSRDGTHRFSKPVVERIRLLAGLGVEGDAHCGRIVQHRSRVAADPNQPNLRQVHLIQAELHDTLNAQGFGVSPGDMGENILTRGLDLLILPRGARLLIGASAIVEITGLRNPCRQLDRFRPGLMQATLDRAADGALIRKAGVMGVVLVDGEVMAGDSVSVDLPLPPHVALDRV